MQKKTTFKVIQKILRYRSLKAPLNNTLKIIHDELGIGEINGLNFELTRKDHVKLKQWVIDEFGINPETDDIPEDRLSVARVSRNEKLASAQVFEGMLQINCLEAQIRLKQGPALTPPGTLLKVKSADIDVENIDTIILVENGTAALNWHNCNIPDDIKTGLMIYRGHNQESRSVRAWLDCLPTRIKKVGFFDFDPAGLGMAVDYKMDSILIPAPLNEQLIVGTSNKPDIFDKQILQRPNLADDLPERLMEIWSWMTEGNKKCAVTQERLISMGWDIEEVAI